MEATFAADKRRPGSWLTRVAVTDSENYPAEGDVVTVKRRDGSTCKATIGRCVWCGPDGEREGVDVALYMTEHATDPEGGAAKRAPPKRAPAKR